MKSTNTQKAQILSYLKRGKALTPIDALNHFGCFRLAARIFDLREDGHDIEREMDEDGYAVYFMTREARAA